MSFHGKVLWDANLAPHQRKNAWRPSGCQSRPVSNLSYVYHWHLAVFNQFHSLLWQLQCEGNCREEDFHVEQEYCSFDRRHFLAYGIQNGDSSRKGYTNYTLFSVWNNYYTYTNYTYYCQTRQDLGLADQVWQDKRATIAKNVDDLGDQFRPAMSAGWLSYIRKAYPGSDAPDAGPPVGQGTLVLPDWVDCASVCY